MIGYLHSRESFGTVDGPGLRFVLFLQGCPLRCRYCHNPDTWRLTGGTPTTVEEILSAYRQNAPFYTKGGITATGGEPLLQIDFLTELFSCAKKEGIHTCLDTSGILHDGTDPDWCRRLDRLLASTDLVLLDIKHMDPEAHRELTGRSNETVLDFARYISERGVDLWIRHPLIPTLTDDPNHLYRLGRFIGGLPTLKALDVLPYHTMGVSKYEQLGVPYTLTHLTPPDKEAVATARTTILRGIRDSHHKQA